MRWARVVRTSRSLWVSEGGDLVERRGNHAWVAAGGAKGVRMEERERAATQAQRRSSTSMGAIGRGGGCAEGAGFARVPVYSCCAALARRQWMGPGSCCVCGCVQACPCALRAAQALARAAMKPGEGCVASCRPTAVRHVQQGRPPYGGDDECPRDGLHHWLCLPPGYAGTA